MSNGESAEKDAMLDFYSSRGIKWYLALSISSVKQIGDQPRARFCCTRYCAHPVTQSLPCQSTQTRHIKEWKGWSMHKKGDSNKHHVGAIILVYFVFVLHFFLGGQGEIARRGWAKNRRTKEGRQILKETGPQEKGNGEEGRLEMRQLGGRRAERSWGKGPARWGNTRGFE